MARYIASFIPGRNSSFWAISWLKAVEGIAGKSADRLGNYHIDLACHAIVDQAVELLTLFGVGAGNTIVGINACKFPAGIPDGTGDIFRQLFPENKPESKTLDVLAECILQLTAQQQDCIRDRFGMQLTIQEIADRGGVTIRAINNRLNKIYKRLKKLMAEHGIE